MRVQFIRVICYRIMSNSFVDLTDSGLWGLDPSIVSSTVPCLTGTGLCSCRVRGVDGSCTKHLTVESYMVIYASNSYTYYY